MNWHTFSTDAVFSKLGTRPVGLRGDEVLRRQKAHGMNVIPQEKPPTLLFLFLSQFTSPLVYVLLFSAVLIYFIHGLEDATVIAIVLFFNALIGTYQEYRSQSTLEGLKKLTTTVAHVIRDGKEIEIPDSEVTIGDIISIREGEKIPADARLFEVQSLRSDESTLTGESTPIDKQIEVIPSPKIATSDQHNMVFKGTTIATGSGKAIVVAIGTQTVIGTLAVTISTLDTEVPLAQKIQKLANSIVICVVIAVGLFFGLSLIKGLDRLDSLTTAISMTVALIPEGLPVILTLVLATSVSRMSKRNVLVKRLQAVEALGSASIIAVDKTGTITLNELSVQEVWLSDREKYVVTGKGFDTKGEFLSNGKRIGRERHDKLSFILRILKSSTSAYVRRSDNTNTPVGDPTEIAGIIAAEKFDPHLPIFPRDEFIPFDYHLKYSMHLFEIDHEKYAIARIGAADVIIKNSTMSEATRHEVEQALHTMQRNGLRVIAIATQTIDHPVPEHSKAIFETTGQFEFQGLLGMQDSLQAGVSEAVSHAQEAGLQIVMITGDHSETARALAQKVGIYRDGDSVLTGDEIEKMSHEELTSQLHPNNRDHTTVFARVSPEHKLQIIQAFRTNGEIIAMTGDGVNDAASLVAADLGIAMGVKGTEVAKDASDIVLLDDNFKSITHAIEEGRALYLTIKNVIVYLLSSSAGEACTLFGALLLGFASPISAAQIIWLNFVTDGFLDVALSFEPHEKNILHSSWTKTSTTLVDKGMFVRILLTGLCMAGGTVFVYSQFSSAGSLVASTMTLTTLAAFQWFHAWNCRSRTLSLTKLSVFANKPLLIATFIVFSLQLMAMYTPLFQNLLHTTPLTSVQWLICIGIASTVLLVDELRKSFFIYK